jgi:AraC-like DNA-binding protein
MRFLTLTGDGVARRERYEEWRERPWPSLARLLRARRYEGEFYSHARIFTLGGAVMSDIHMSGQTCERPPSLIRADGFDAVTFAVTLQGRIHGETRAGSFQGGPRSIFISDMGSPSVMSTTNARSVSLTFARKEIQRFVPRIETLHGLILTGRRAQPLVHQIEVLTTQLPEMDETAVGPAGDRLIGALLSCLSASGACDLPEEAEQARLQSEIRWIIEQRFHEPDLSVARIAALARVSRATLYRAFNEPDGIAASLMRLRLARAAEQLRDPADTRQIGEIAYAVGFVRIDSFSRAFRNVYGCSPREWRGR